jgi:hypothetical protein
MRHKVLRDTYTLPRHLIHSILRDNRRSAYGRLISVSVVCGRFLESTLQRLGLMKTGDTECGGQRRHFS